MVVVLCTGQCELVLLGWGMTCHMYHVHAHGVDVFKKIDTAILG